MENFNNYLDIVFSNVLLSVVLLVLLVYATYTDIKYLKIYNKFNLSIIGVRILFMIIPKYQLPFSFQNLIASAIAFLSFLILAMIFMHKMGGDIKFIASFMLFFNFEYMIIFVMISSLLNLIYALSLKMFLRHKQRKINDTQKSNKSNRGNIIIYYIIKIFFVKIPKDSELALMTEKDLNKYKLPFAPFFLMSYIITYILYLI